MTLLRPGKSRQRKSHDKRQEMFTSEDKPGELDHQRDGLYSARCVLIACQQSGSAPQHTPELIIGLP